MSVTKIATPDHISAYTAALAVEAWEHQSGKLRAVICCAEYDEGFELVLYRLHAGGRHGIWHGVGPHEIPTRTAGFATPKDARVGARDALNNTSQR